MSPRRETGKPDLLLAVDVAPFVRERLRALCTVHDAATPEARAALVARGLPIRAIVTNSSTPIPASLIEALPDLGIICAQGVGTEGIDLAAARARGIAVTNSPGANNECVADHAMALMLAVLRDVPRFHARVREGRWRDGTTMRPGAHGKRVGILGLGAIGRRVAKRCAGFDMAVAYHNRSPLPDAASPDPAWTYAPTPAALAAASDVLVVTLPGGPGTRHLVGREVLDALGPDGFLVNVGRGSVVDTAALVEALRDGRLGGAALDVIEGEPEVPAALRDLPRLVMTPHMAGRSPDTLAAQVETVVANLGAFFAGRTLPNPVSEAP